MVAFSAHLKDISRIGCKECDIHEHVYFHTCSTPECLDQRTEDTQIPHVTYVRIHITHICIMSTPHASLSSLTIISTHLSAHLLILHVKQCIGTQ